MIVHKQKEISFTWETGELETCGGLKFAVGLSNNLEQSEYADPRPAPAPNATEAQRVAGLPIRKWTFQYCHSIRIQHNENNINELQFDSEDDNTVNNQVKNNLHPFTGRDAIPAIAGYQ